MWYPFLCLTIHPIWFWLENDVDQTGSGPQILKFPPSCPPTGMIQNETCVAWGVVSKSPFPNAPFLSLLPEAAPPLVNVQNGFPSQNGLHMCCLLQWFLPTLVASISHAFCSSFLSIYSPTVCVGWKLSPVSHLWLWPPPHTYLYWVWLSPFKDSQCHFFNLIQVGPEATISRNSAFSSHFRPVALALSGKLGCDMFTFSACDLLHAMLTKSWLPMSLSWWL